jgi:hypothetical protein
MIVLSVLDASGWRGCAGDPVRLPRRPPLRADSLWSPMISAQRQAGSHEDSDRTARRPVPGWNRSQRQAPGANACQLLAVIATRIQWFRPTYCGPLATPPC